MTRQSRNKVGCELDGYIPFQPAGAATQRVPPTALAGHAGMLARLTSWQEGRCPYGGALRRRDEGKDRVSHDPVCARPAAGPPDQGGAMI